MSSKKGLGRLYDRLTQEERFRLDVLALARGDEEESERLTATCPRRGYTMNDWEFVGRWDAARELALLAYVDVVTRRLDKIDTIAASRGLFPYLSTIWQYDAHVAYLDGHEAGSHHAWNRSGKAGEPPGWEAEEEEAERNADPTIDEDLQKWTGEGRYASLEGKLEEMERELVREALTAWLDFAGFCAQEMGLEAKDLVEALGRPFAEGVRDLEGLSARHEVETDVEDVEEYLVMMTEAWRRDLESA